MTPLELALELEKAGTVEWKHLREAAKVIRQQYAMIQYYISKDNFGSFEEYPINVSKDE